MGKFQMRSFWKKATFTIILERCNMSPHLLPLIQPTSPPKSTSRQPRERRCETLPRLWRISSGQSSTSPNTLREVTCRCSLCWKPRARRRESHTKTLDWFTNLSLSLSLSLLSVMCLSLCLNFNPHCCRLIIMLLQFFGPFWLTEMG